MCIKKAVKKIIRKKPTGNQHWVLQSGLRRELEMVCFFEKIHNWIQGENLSEKISSGNDEVLEHGWAQDGDQEYPE